MRNHPQFKKFFVMLLTSLTVVTPATVPQDFGTHVMDSGRLFLPAVTYDTGGTAPVSVAIADVNGDGKPDIVVANEFGCSGKSEGSVAVLLGNGNGTFQSAVCYGSKGTNAISVAIADVNGDGKPDIVVANQCKILGCSGSSEGGVAVLLGNGNGTFQSGVIYDSGGEIAVAVAVADVNEDGRPDIAVANFISPGGGSAGVLLGNGDGTFQAAVTYGVTTNVNSVTIADVNGDGKPDLLVVSGEIPFGGVSVFLGNGDGTFVLKGTDSSGGGAFSAAVADVNGDGIPDLLVANECTSHRDLTCSGGSLAVLLGNGDGSFQSPVTYNSGGVLANSVVALDVNGDGKMDAVIANCAPIGQSGCNAFINGVVGVLLGNGDGTFQPVMTYDAGGPNVEAVAAADLRRIGKPDLVTTSFSRANVVGVLLNNTVIKSSTSTALTSNLNPSVYGQKVTWTATVTSSGISPTGKLRFTWNGNTIGSATLNSSGVATLTKSNLNADTFPLIAVYLGDANNLGSTSAVLNQVVLQATSTAALTSSPNPSMQGQPVTFTATVSSPTVLPRGPVTFTAGKTVLGTAQLVGGKAKLTISSLSVGSTKVTATYNGDSNITKSSASVIQTVQ